MPGTRERGRAIRHFILGQVDSNRKGIAHLTATHFNISRQAVNKHLHRLVREGLLTVEGTTRNRGYALAVLDQKSIFVPLTSTTAEDHVWREKIAPLLSDLPRRARDIWQYGFTEMLNNAIDHSSGTSVHVTIERTALSVKMDLMDDGEGIFRKIQRELNLFDERHSVLELAKGKLTTDPDHHTGEGIFFTSRIFDEFYIRSGEVFFSHQNPKDEDWILEAPARPGTAVFLTLSNATERTTKEVFDEFASGEDYGFSKTVVPVGLVRYGDEALISRSQAKRLLTRFERFRTVILDFEGIEQIGQGFADEVFRVFAQEHPDIELVPIKANAQVRAMIGRVSSGR
ncbi:MAG: DUF4325 domain-containing protein [Desulfurellaceae bacterium]|nr:DUF4325 domain-containing protein [Desulfurellaceae bacterium]